MFLLDTSPAPGLGQVLWALSRDTARVSTVIHHQTRRLLLVASSRSRLARHRTPESAKQPVSCGASTIPPSVSRTPPLWSVLAVYPSRMTLVLACPLWPARSRLSSECRVHTMYPRARSFATGWQVINLASRVEPVRRTRRTSATAAHSPERAEAAVAFRPGHRLDRRRDRCPACPVVPPCLRLSLSTTASL